MGYLVERQARLAEQAVVADNGLLVLGIEKGEEVLHLVFLLVGGSFVGQFDEVGMERLRDGIHSWGDATKSHHTKTRAA